MPSIRCKCNAVTIELSVKMPLWRLECCCHDCTAALWYVNKYKGAPSPPLYQMVDSLWFPNNFRVSSGLEELGAYKNFERADTIRFYCKRCWTCLIADHEFYEQRVILTQVLSFKEYVGSVGLDLFPPRCRHFTKDLNQGQRISLPEFSGDKKHIYESIGDNFAEAIDDIKRAGGKGQMNIQKLAELAGQPFVPENERQRMAEGPPTLMQQAREEQ